MTEPDIDTAMFKLLSYAQACFVKGVRPDVGDAREVVDVSPAYFDNLMRAASDEGLLAGVSFVNYVDRPEPVLCAWDWRITLKGNDYLRRDRGMREAAAKVGETLAATIASAVTTAILRQAGL